MKLLIPCMECLKKNGVPALPFMNVEICDDGLYKATCNQGHETITLLQEDKFEILFDMGAMALLDNYNREAVSSFAASLERFYEFCIKVFLKKRKVDSENFDNTWKLVSNQSERQLGAFYFLYLDTYRKAPIPIKDNQIKFRNQVIHKGYIPTYDETVKYADYIMNYMLQILKELKATCQNEIQEVVSNRLAYLHQKSIKDGIQLSPATMCIPTIVNLVNPTDMSFVESLDALKKRTYVYG